MTTSGTFNFSPSVGDLVSGAFSILGTGRTQLTAEHLADGYLHLNLMFISWANKGPNLWEVDSQTVTLVSGTATYSVPSTTIAILDAFVTNTLTGVDRLVESISRSRFSAIPNKATQAQPTCFWFDRLVSPSITLWPVPNLSNYTLTYYRFRQTQDAAYTSGQTPEVPQRWLDALLWGLAERLSWRYAADKLQVVSARAMTAYQEAATQDVETAQTSMTLDMSEYYP